MVLLCRVGILRLALCQRLTTSRSSISVPSSGNVSLDDGDTAWSTAFPAEVSRGDAGLLDDSVTYAFSSTSVAPNVSTMVIMPSPPGRIVLVWVLQKHTPVLVGFEQDLRQFVNRLLELANLNFV